MKFLPSISLVTILLSILAVFFASLIWLTAKIIRAANHNVKTEQVLIFMGYYAVLSLFIYAGKALFKNISVNFQMKIALITVIFLLSLFLAWSSRNKAVRWIDVILEHISPLVWLFGAFAIFSVPLVAYHAWVKDSGKSLSRQIGKPAESNNGYPNVLLITFDAMTALDMSAYGYHRPTTPFIEEWAKSATVFTKVEAGSNYTTPTTASLMTGKRVWTHQTYFVEVASDIINKNNENLPFVLKKNGYSNMALQQIHRASVEKLGIADSFDIILGPEKLSYSINLYNYIDTMLYSVFGEKIILYDWIIKEDFILFKLLNILFRDSSVTPSPPEIAFGKALDILGSDFPSPFFAWIHLFAPHDPYLPPAPFSGMFDPSSALRTRKSQMTGKVIDQIDLYRARYDEFIRYADKRLESFMKEFKKRNAFNNTLIILSADHGESFEHNFKGHGGPHLFEQVTHIPLVIKEPGQNQGMIIDGLAEQVDITPTILELVGIPVPSWMEGRSLAPLLRGKALEPRPAFSMSLDINPGRNQKITNGTIAVWEDDYKLIHYLDKQKSLLFNLADDPAEVNNIFDKEPDTGSRLLSLIFDNLKKANEKIEGNAL
ncbi:MAG: sulfatase [Nitrospirota bacterium]